MNERIQRMKNSKALTVLLSVLIACIVWIYVINDVDPDINDTIRNVPITVAGQEELEERGLMVTDLSADDLDLRLTGKRNALVNLTNKNIPITVDVSSVLKAGEYNLRCTVTLPTNITGGEVTVNNRETYRISVTVEERVQKTVEIRGIFSGSVAKGYQGGDFLLSPTEIELSGPSGLLETIDYAAVELTGSNLKETYSGLLELELVTKEGKTLSIDQVDCKASAIYAVYPVEMVKDVELTVDFLDGGGATRQNILYEIFPKSIRVSGSEKSLAALTSISLGSIDLAEVGGNHILILPIELPVGVKSVSGTEEAKVSVEFRGLSTKTVQVERFELLHIPEGYTAELLTEALSVTVRGSAEAVAALNADELRAEVDLSAVTPAEGEADVPVTVWMPETDGVGLIRTEHTVRVALTQ